MSRYRELDFTGVNRFPFEERETKVDVGMFGRPDLDDDSFSAFYRGLPDILVAKDLKAEVASVSKIGL